MFKKRRVKEPASPNRMMLRRTLFLMIVCGIVAFILLGARLFKLQILDHDMYETAAVEQQLRETTVVAKRGTIYDRNMNILAMSASVSNIYISPAEIKMYDEDPALIASGLSEILEMDYADILERTTHTESWYSTVARKVEDDIADRVREFKETNHLVGVKIEESSKRYYPYRSLGCHVVGFVSADDRGLTGMEFYYDDVLSGTDGRIVRATNAYGTDMMFTEFEDYYDAEDGQSIVLTLDETVQYYLETELAIASEQYDLRDGAAGIVMDVNTGGILGMASLGNFDLNDYLALSEADQEEVDEFMGTTEEKEALIAEKRSAQWRNKALSDTYEPGSVFKIITLAAGLESGVVNPNSSFYCGGNINVLGRTDPLNCWSTSGHGSLSLADAVKYSCNVSFVTIGQLVGAERFYEYIRAFGLFDRTGLDLTGESGSLWWSDDVFTDRSNMSQLAAASFGQTFTITPIQLITAVSAVANGGYLMKPYLVSTVLDADGSVAKQNEPTVVRQVVSEETSRICCEMLEQVVNSHDGTGKNAYVAGYRVAGKTGTSEDVVYEATHGTKKYITSFLGFAPADDPKVAVLVLLENPGPNAQAAVSGGAMGAPTVGKILGDILPYLGVNPEYDDGENALVDQKVPRLVGKSVSEATAALEELGFAVRTSGEGEAVTAQMPSANARIAAGSEVVIYCGGTPAAEQVEMIDLTGLSYEIARVRAGWSNIYIHGEGTMMDSSTIMIVRQSIEPGTLVDPGTVVTVTLSDSSMGTVMRT